MQAAYFLQANWEYLAMVNYQVPPRLLLPYLPPYTELDLYEDMALVSLVGFQFNETKVLGIGWPWHKNFDEVNLRFYVKRFNGHRWERGVAFVSEIVPRSLIVLLANTFYNERYSRAAMFHGLVLNEESVSVEYSWKKSGRSWNKLLVVGQNQPQDIIAGSAEEFIFEHYTGFSRLNETTTVQYTIEHPRWQVYPVIQSEVQCDWAGLYGPEFASVLQEARPRSVFLARGSAVKVRLPKRIHREALRTLYIR